jgi:hypothetical protein
LIREIFDWAGEEKMGQLHLLIVAPNGHQLALGGVVGPSIRCFKQLKDNINDLQILLRGVQEHHQIICIHGNTECQLPLWELLE